MRLYSKITLKIIAVIFCSILFVAFLFMFYIRYIPHQVAVSHMPVMMIVILSGTIISTALIVFILHFWLLSPFYQNSLKRMQAHSAILSLQAEERIEELKKLANYDIVTGLPNRTLLNEHLQKMILEAETKNETLVVMILEFINCHDINNTFGIHMGNLFLKEMGKHLVANNPKDSFIAHISTSRFALLRKINAPAQSISFVQYIHDLFARPFDIADKTLLSGINIGAALYPRDANDAQTLLLNTHLALKRAKENGLNQSQFFEVAMNRQNTDRHRTLLVDLHYALEKNQFILHYQPQMDLQTNTLIGAEVLLRWQHPEKGIIFPGEFIHLVEETGLIVAIGKWILYTACEQLKRLQAEIPGFKFVAVNLSPVQFKQKDIVNVVTQVLAKTNIDPKGLELEITEGSTMSNIEEALITLQALRALGVSLALDDFGTGYSSLSYLRHFPITKLKIDQSFIKELKEKNSEENYLPGIIIELGHLLNLRVIAEGVETKAQANYLKERHCDEVQGHLYGKAMPLQAFITQYTRG